MKITLDIDIELLEAARQATGLDADQAVVEFALRRLLKLHGQREIRTLRGAISWEGDVDAMRRER